MLTLNLACGDNKIPGCVNIDAFPGCKPDLVADITKKLPYDDEVVDKIYLFHAIEHIPEALHEQVLTEFYRILKPGGILVMSYPEFRVCAHYWAINHRGLKDFWKATIYGRQAHPGDFHVTLMDTPAFVDRLKVYGFEVFETRAESGEEYNSVVKARKGRPLMTYEDVLRREIFGE